MMLMIVLGHRARMPDSVVAHALKAVFVKLRQNVDFETGFCTITAILDVELVISRKHTKYFALTNALKLEEMLAFH
jgi:hypothetical protein